MGIARHLQLESVVVVGGDKPRRYVVGRSSSVGAAVYPRPQGLKSFRRIDQIDQFGILLAGYIG